MPRRNPRRLGKLLLLAAAVVALAAGGTALLFERAMPDYSGAAPLPGLSAEARVYRDRWGAPHIFAADKNDAARALGYVHASERLFQMQMQRRAGQGRLAEVAGEDMLAIDLLLRTLGLYRLAQSSFAALSPDAQGYLQAYAEGVNAWLAAHRNRLPPELLLMGGAPEPWTPADSLVWGKLMALKLSANSKLEVLRARLAGRLSASRMEALFPNTPGPITIEPRRSGGGEAGQPGRRASIPATDSPTALADSTPRFGSASGASLLSSLQNGASNEWVVGGQHTASGKPILANDPHLDFEAPILWYLARMVTPDMTIKGATVPGAPVVLLGQNDAVAWGFTTTDSDVQDLFIETLDPEDPNRYLTPEGSAKFETRLETFRVKGASDIVLNVRATRHGPVLSDIDPELRNVAGQGKVVALAFTSLGADDTTSEALLRLNRARGADDIVDALKAYKGPQQNIVYADRAGHIGFIAPGLLPIRKSGDGRMPADGASGAFDWIAMAPYEKLPQLRDPEAGFIFNANNAVVPRRYSPSLGVDWQAPYRARRIQAFMDEGGQHTLDVSARMQADHVSLPAKDLLPALLSAKAETADAKEALALLGSWDAVMDKDRPEPLIFEAWLYNMRRLLLVEKTGDTLKEKGPSAGSIAAILQNDAAEWCGAGDADCARLKGRALDRALSLLKKRQGDDMKAWRWGRENVATFRHNFFSHIPLLDRLSEIRMESGGDAYTLDCGGGNGKDGNNPFARTHGPGYRAIYDLGDPDASRFMIATGQSGHIFSRHYADLAPLWLEGRSITLAGSEDDLKRQGVEMLTLTP
jgi:penicillin G amidase